LSIDSQIAYQIVKKEAILSAPTFDLLVNRGLVGIKKGSA